MTNFVGVDWASGCWVTVTYEEEPTISTEPSILNVWEKYGDDAVILVDVPIGLAEEGSRECDREAREMLKNRGSTVFTPPTRDAVAQREYHDACDENGDSGIGSQSWWIVPQIREVDALFDHVEEAKESVFESHPEVCFAMLDNDESLASKHSEDGQGARLRLLKSAEGVGDVTGFGENVSAFIDDRRENGEWFHRIRSGRLDDVVDAAVLALTAAVADDQGFSTLPEDRDQTEKQVIVHPGDELR